MKILLFSDIPPCMNYTAGIVLKKMCDFLLEEGHIITCFTVMNPSLSPEIYYHAGLSFKNLPKPRENWNGGIRSAVMNGWNAHFVLSGMAKEVAEYALEEQCELIWVVEQGQTMIQMGIEIARLTKLPYAVQTWDPTEWWLKENKSDRLTSRRVMKQYGQLLSGAECFIAASWAMEKNFGEKYGCKRSKAVVLGMKDEVIRPNGLHKDDEFVIALSGQIYAKDEFEALIQALNILDWGYHGKKIILKLYGAYFHLSFPKESNVVIRGWIEQTRLLSELADADLLYCAYWFSEEYAVVSKNSFPSKLSTYLKIGKPILFHGPVYASPSLFLKGYDAGYQCNSNNPYDLAACLRYIIDDPYKEEVCQRERKAFRNALTDTCMKHDFFEALDLPIKRKEEKRERGMDIRQAVQEYPVRVTHVNNVDIVGNRFNGFDMMKTVTEAGGWMRQLVMEKLGDYAGADTIVSPKVFASIDPIIRKFEEDQSIHCMVQPYAHELMEHAFFQNTEIVHYHLIHNGIISILDLPELVKRKKSVLTIHDPWLFTGHCIHPITCHKWENGCEDCPYPDRIFSMKKDNTKAMWEVKKQVFSGLDIDLIVSSDWMMNIARKSPITRECRIHQIPFGIDLDLFKEREDRMMLRERLGIEKNRFVLMFREDVSEFKGMQYILEMLKQMEDKSDITLLTVGDKGKLGNLDPGIQVVEAGFILHDEKMAELYASCDLFLMPSIAESFGMMAVEAMASQRPVLCFQGTAVEEVTYAPECGIAVEAGNVKAMLEVVEKLRRDPEERRRRGETGRKLAEEHYNYQDYVLRHLQLYQEIAARPLSED